MIGLVVALASLAAIVATGAAAANPPGDRRRARRVDCCDAESDDWRTSWDVYRRWRDEGPLGFQAAYVECFRDSLEFARAGDYGKPADRRCILGKMHAHKRGAWLACRRGCRGQVADGIEVLEDVAGTVYRRRGESTSYLVRSDERGDWLLERYGRGPVRELARLGSYAEADGRVRELLAEVPF